jgi:thioredoxin 1
VLNDKESSVVEIISAERFQQEIFDFETHQEWQLKSELPVVLNFFATWCGPCHLFAPVLEQVSEDYKGRLKVYKIDIDAYPMIPRLFEVRSVPTTLFLAPNEEPALSLGAMPIDKMKHAIKDLLNLE